MEDELIRRAVLLSVMLLVFVAIVDGKDALALAPPDPVDGKVVYNHYCVACHGPQGNGQGLAAPAMFPHPANFTDPNLWKGRSDAFFINVITNGRKRVMPPWWDVITAQEIQDVYAYVKTTFKPK